MKSVIFNDDQFCSTLKKNLHLESLNVRIEPDSRAQFEAVADYLDSNSGSLEFLVLFTFGMSRAWEGQPKRLKILQALSRNIHIRYFSTFADGSNLDDNADPSIQSELDLSQCFCAEVLLVATKDCAKII
jgi:hypothetical protein